MIEPQPWRDRFSSFVERKTREAIAAATPPYVTDASTPEPSLIPVANNWSASRFDGPFYVTPPGADQSRPACSLVFVQSADGNTGASDPALLGGGQTDKHVIYEGLSRVAADGVLAGASTVRDGTMLFSLWHPELVDLRRSLGLPRHPVQIVATTRGLDIDRGLLFNVPEVPVILLTAPGAAAGMAASVAGRPWIRLITMPAPSGLTYGFRALRELGIGRVSCIGGRTLATALLDLGLVDDIYLTTASQPGGEPGTPMYPRRLDAEIVVRKRGTAQESGVVFEHFHLRTA